MTPFIYAIKSLNKETITWWQKLQCRNFLWLGLVLLKHMYVRCYVECFRNTNPFNPPNSPMGNYIINPNVQIRKPSLLRKRSQDQQLSETGLRFEPTFPWLQRLCFCPWYTTPPNAPPKLPITVYHSTFQQDPLHQRLCESVHTGHPCLPLLNFEKNKLVVSWFLSYHQRSQRDWIFGNNNSDLPESQA